MNNTAIAPAKTNKKRATYGFQLNFPETFTMRQLRNLKGRSIKYITLYKRVESALKSGVIVVTGKQEPKNARKGRKELIYSRVNAKTVVVATTPTELVALSDLS